MSVLSACPDLTFDSGLIAAAVVFCVGSSILFREGPFFRPHPIVWKLALAVAIMYELVLVFLLFQVCAACKSPALLSPFVGRGLGSTSTVLR